MSLESDLFTLLKQPDYIPLPLQGLIEKLQLPSKNSKDLENLLSRLIKQGKIAKIKSDRYVLPKDADLIPGIIRFKVSGSALLIPDTQPGEPSTDPIPIRAEDTRTALHGDHILARIKRERVRFYSKNKRAPKDSPQFELYAQVKHILERVHSTITGTLKKSSTYHYIIPDDPRFVQDVVVPDPSKLNIFPKPSIDDKVIVRLLDWEHRKLSPEGEIIEVLGKTHTPNAELQALLHKYKLNTTFPDHVIQELQNVPSKVSTDDLKNRLDCRKLFTLTIDPDDAKDFDDAISFEEINDKEWRIGVHIADVAYYVRPGTMIDTEAKKRGNSTYLVETVIPMLPQALSNGICSLVEAEDRLTKAVFFTFTTSGKILKTEFANAVIRSNKRLTYKQAYAFLTLNDLDAIRSTPLPAAHRTGSTGRPLSDLSNTELSKIKDTISKLWKIAEKLRNDRMHKGSLDLDMPEVKIFTDESGAASRIEKILNDESHQLIEEFMLAANEAVARELHYAQLPFISRIHDKPDAEKLGELRETLLDFNIVTGDLTNRKAVIKLLKEIKDHPQAHSLKYHFLRSLKQACYRGSADGHYGLFKVFYTHFTSPIRRYSDLIVHRIFEFYLVKTANPTALQDLSHIYRQSDINNLAQHLSLTEQNSTEAERESVKIKLMEFFQQELQKSDKNPMRAVITDVREHGIFIELTDSLAFGFIHISSLKDDLYRLNNNGTAFIGRRTKRSFTIGQYIHVYVERVDRYKRQLDFILAEEDFTQKDPSIPSPQASPQRRSRRNYKTPPKR